MGREQVEKRWKSGRRGENDGGRINSPLQNPACSNAYK